MRIRIALHYDLGDGSAAGGSELALLADHAAAAESAGADVAWVAERPTEAGAIPASLPACGAIAACTERLHVGTAVLPLPLHHPLRVAEDGATLDVLSGGRFELGVGLGDDPDALAGFGIASEERAARLEEAVGLVRAAWADGPLHFEGRHYQADDLELAPRPLSAGGPPIWVGAGAPAAQRRAARLAAGLLAAPGADPTPFLLAWAERDAGTGPRLALPIVPEPAAGDWSRSAAGLIGRLGAHRVDQLDLLVPVRSCRWDPAAAIGELASMREALA